MGLPIETSVFFGLFVGCNDHQGLFDHPRRPWKERSPLDKFFEFSCLCLNVIDRLNHIEELGRKMTEAQDGKFKLGDALNKLCKLQQAVQNQARTVSDILLHISTNGYLIDRELTLGKVNVGAANDFCTLLHQQRRTAQVFLQVYSYFPAVVK